MNISDRIWNIQGDIREFSTPWYSGWVLVWNKLDHPRNDIQSPYDSLRYFYTYATTKKWLYDFWTDLSRKEIANTRVVFTDNENIPIMNTMIHGNIFRTHLTLEFNNKISDIEKVFMLLKLRNMNRKLHKKEELLLQARIMFEHIINRPNFFYHNTRVKVYYRPKGFISNHIGTHNFDQSWDFRNFSKK